MSALLACLRRLLLACVLGGLASLALPATSQAATCGPATGKGTAPADFRDYCWLDFSTYNDTTARSNSGQAFTFNLPDGTTVKMTLKTTNGNLKSVAVPSWTGSAFGNAAFTGIPGQPILYTSVDGGAPTVTLSNITVTPPTGGTSQYSIVVGDGESTNNGETLTFTTTGNAWQTIAQIQNGTSTLYPTLSGQNSKTVKETGVAGTVGSYVFRSDGNPTQVSAAMVASGLQGIIVGMRYASISVVSQFVNARYNAADQVTYGLSTSSGSVLVSNTSSGTGLNGFPVAAMPTVAASYPFVVSQSMAAGSVGTLANYKTTLTCTNNNTGTSNTTMPSNQEVDSYTFPTLAYGDSVLCTFTNTPIFNQIVGTVYNDANHDSVQGSSEAGPGISGVYVKVAPVSGGVCTGPATQAIQVDASTGAYTIPNLAQGTYCVILDNNATLSDITPTLPTGWLGTQNSGGSLQVVVPAGSPTPVPQIFGIYNGSRLTGTVFADTGAGSGIANNGSKDGTEAGLANLTVTAKSGTTTVASATTGADGSFTLWVPASISATVTVTPTIPTNYFATGGSVGTTGGTFSRPTVTYTPVAGQSYTGVGFGLATPNTFAPNAAQTAQPGTAVFYAHTYDAGTGGQVTFSLAGVSNPASPTWSAVLYQDTNCNATLESTEPVISGPLTVSVDQQVCIIVKQFVPAGIGYGAQNTATVTATFNYTNASPALSSTLTVTDTTTAGEPSALNLKKMVNNVTRGGAAGTTVTANPGDVLQYTLTAQNNGGTSLSTLVINDATPAFTTFVTAACPGTLPSGITGCAITTQPTAGTSGGVKWTLTGTLAAGATIAVTYQVKLDQ